MSTNSVPYITLQEEEEMKKICKNKKIAIFMLLFTLIFTVIAYAYTEGVGGSIILNVDDIVFNASVSTSLKATDLNRIQLYHEGVGRGEILFRYGSVDKNQYYNKLSHKSTEEDAEEGIYTSMIIGEIDYKNPNYQDFIGYDENEYHHNLNYVMHKIMDKQKVDKKNKEAAVCFNIDLDSYTEISKDNKKFKENLLFLLCPQVEAARGDSVPTIFLDHTQNSGIVLKQDKSGLNYKYSFIKEDNRWTVIDKVVSQ